VTHFLTRHRKRWIAVAGVTLIVFAHAAIAVSGCLQGSMPVPESGCEEHRQAVPSALLCRTHLQAENQTLDLSRLPQIAFFDVPVLVLEPERRALPAAAVRVRPVPILFAGAPPPLNVLYSRSLT